MYKMSTWVCCKHCCYVLLHYLKAVCAFSLVFRSVGGGKVYIDWFYYNKMKEVSYVVL